MFPANPPRIWFSNSLSSSFFVVLWLWLWLWL